MTFSFEEKTGPAPGVLIAGAGAAGLLFFIIGFWKPYSSDEFWFLAKTWDYLGSGSLDSESMIHPPLYLLLTSGLISAF
ncbi:MAG: hypothetical protein RDU13_02745, partial [Elusimicrobiales bacterium]|nr:hypothetical protein [Elusimicrobiales bacterium]